MLMASCLGNKASSLSWKIIMSLNATDDDMFTSAASSLGLALCCDVFFLFPGTG